MIQNLKNDFVGLFRGRWTLARLTNANAVFSMRSGRGKGIMNGLWLGLTTLVALSIKYPWIEVWWGIFILPAYLWLAYFIGYIDEIYLGFWQREREKASTHANPYTQRIESRLEDIQARLDRIEGKKSKRCKDRCTR
jgi:hypothetical protein